MTRRRADAERNIAAILDAAVLVLADRPDAGLGEIAKAAGVVRQTIYAHFPSRDDLLEAVADRALEQTLTAIDAADPESGPPAEALDRLIQAWWTSVARHARVLEALAAVSPSRAALHDFHGPVLARLNALLERGDFDRDVPATWFLALMHAAADDVAAGRLDEAAAAATLRRAVPKLFTT
ncbi:TetR/AcrR family transcriptional regulator [Solirubrobacter soli]|uniref:TetR/AcrR family transcriptional regulator n=1 Tax=Solirubrobacter soli TaxID=363832 RepID=UPI00040A7F31|nr:TetR/AcrR family transcriptional regulator [Solirubrobacter soli]